MTDTQAVLFDLEAAHRLSMLPKLPQGQRGWCHCGWESIVCRTVDDVHDLHKKHLALQR